VCPLDHPATEQTPWGQAVSRKSDEGGGWFTWVFSTEDISQIESKFGRNSLEGHRMRPNGTELVWKQIGVKEIVEFREFPFFIEWLSSDHPSQDGIPFAEIEKIEIAAVNGLEDSWFKEEILASLGDIELVWVDSKSTDMQSGIVAVHLTTPTGKVILD
jgi:hypothetical protein